MLFYALFYTMKMAFILLFYLFLFYILHKNKSADTIQTSNKYSIKLLNIHY
jgi:Ca2+/Na+ antiporter